MPASSRPCCCRSPGSASRRRPNPRGASWRRCAREYQLSQAQLGEIDPASETIKLATLGMRGVAANMLWDKANEYKQERRLGQPVGHARTNRQAAAQLRQRLDLPGLEPVVQHLGRVRRLPRPLLLGHQGHRLPQGRHQVQHPTSRGCSPRSARRSRSKIGRADEQVQFRRLFRDDDDFNGDCPQAQRDNWLVGREWMLQGRETPWPEGVPIRGEVAAACSTRTR